MIHPLHHLDARRRFHLKHKPFPSNKLFVRYLDYWVTILGFVSSLAMLPQAFEIWQNQDATNVSLLTWGFFTLWALTMLIYGVVHNARPIIMTYIMSFIIDVAVVAGIIVY